jgi:hypothetical protein
MPSTIFLPKEHQYMPVFAVRNAADTVGSIFT